MIPEIGVVVTGWDQNCYSDYHLYQLKDLFTDNKIPTGLIGHLNTSKRVSLLPQASSVI